MLIILRQEYATSKISIQKIKKHTTNQRDHSFNTNGLLIVIITFLKRRPRPAKLLLLSNALQYYAFSLVFYKVKKNNVNNNR